MKCHWIPLLKDFVIPLVSIFLGAWLAFLFEKKSRKDEREERFRAHLRLLRDDIEKAKVFLGELADRLQKTGPTPTPQFFYLLPTSYFASIDFVGLSTYVSSTCVEHIRNITEYVFPRWNDGLQPLLDDPRLTNDQKKQAILQLAQGTISACNVVVSAINKELKDKEGPLTDTQPLF